MNSKDPSKLLLCSSHDLPTTDHEYVANAGQPPDAPDSRAKNTPTVTTLYEQKPKTIQLVPGP